MEKIETSPEFKVMDSLQTGEELAAFLAAFLTEVLAINDPGFLAGQLGLICKAHGMSKIAAHTGIARESLYKALRDDAQPRFETIHKVLAALGLRLVVVPKPSTAPYTCSFSGALSWIEPREQAA